MAVFIAPQRLALEDLQRLLLENDRHRLNLMIAIAAIEERNREAAQRPPRRRRRWQVKPWVGRRKLTGQFYHLFDELDRETRMDYQSYVRMSRNDFQELVARLTPRITKSDL